MVVTWWTHGGPRVFKTLTPKANPKEEEKDTCNAL